MLLPSRRRDLSLQCIAQIACQTPVALVQIATDNKEAILGSIPAEHKEEGAKLYTALLEEKVSFL
jgi:hypothetical protein